MNGSGIVTSSGLSFCFSFYCESDDGHKPLPSAADIPEKKKNTNLVLPKIYRILQENRALGILSKWFYWNSIQKSDKD